MRRLAKFLRFGRREQALLLSAWSTLLAYKVALKVCPFRRLAEYTSRIPCDPRRQARSGFSAADIARALDRISGYVPGGRNCLARALSGKRLLARRGYASLLRIGVARLGGQFEAHAWLEHEGTILIGGEGGVDQFSPFPADRIP